ncbi:hypothetical protein D9599_02845 [Roseomonas sp. KE2513]|uniref:hypothetical protein n=1 Tax=Roseomonas sp. KE2513 TaxID=2479202 RepID=UPI0018DFBA42|nr:hypothetical protein [Roseomonas sp. KE2513]MBI0534507.1 hypothetical protein [Roseomonas sp. KE2513]
MRWILGSFFVVALASLASTGQAMTPGAVTTSVESAREVASVTQDVASRRHRRHVRHRRAITR